MINHFKDQTFALLTLHSKEKVMAPVLGHKLNVKILLTQAYDTDALGTFSGEIERTLTPRECAQKKAELACSLTGCAIGLGSEGSFNPGLFGLTTFNEELVACVNIEENWTVVGRSCQPSSVREQLCQNVGELDEFIDKTPFDQGLILKTECGLSKGLYGAATIYAQLQQWYGNIINWPLTISYDLRAHHSPQRRKRIAEATENLAERLLRSCPNCNHPGFWPDQINYGLPCICCGTPTNAVMQRISICQSCQYQQVIEVEEEFADPFNCPSCNP